MPTQFSNESREIIALTRSVAERYVNNFIGTPHFLLCLNAFNKKGRLSILITFNDKRHLIESIKGIKYNDITSDDYPLTVPVEQGLRSSGFHCWIMGDEEIQPEHIYLGIVGADENGKQMYLNLLKEAGIHLNRLKQLVIEFYFNSFARKTDIFKILN